MHYQSEADQWQSFSTLCFIYFGPYSFLRSQQQEPILELIFMLPSNKAEVLNWSFGAIRGGGTQNFQSPEHVDISAAVCHRHQILAISNRARPIVRTCEPF